LDSPLSAIFESVAVGMVLLDGAGRITEANLVPNYRSFFRFVYPDDLRDVLRSIRRALYGGENVSVGYRIVRPDGTCATFTPSARRSATGRDCRSA